VPYLTPDSIPEDDDCRPLSIPASTDWLAIVSGALTELTKSYNWQQAGSVTVDEAVARMQVMVNAYYVGCVACTIPGGTPLFRLNPDTGAIEELSPNGEWEAPSGDYELPPTPTRSEGTSEERICAAAANAANVLQILYENLSDSFNSSLSYDAAVAAFVAAIAGAIGSVFGIVVTPLIVIFAILFGVVYATVEFVTADLWDDTFTQKLVCVLVSCAADDSDVVHFDLNCVLEALAHGTDYLDPTTSELRLFGQIYTILQFLGSQSLDAAGATTAITDADCSDCEGEWCALFDFNTFDMWTVNYGTLTGDGIEGEYGNVPINVTPFTGTAYGALADISIVLADATNITKVTFDWFPNYTHDDGGTGWRVQWAGLVDANANGQTNGDRVDDTGDITVGAQTGTLRVSVDFGYSGAPYAPPDPTCLLKWVKIQGTGTRPEGWPFGC